MITFLRGIVDDTGSGSVDIDVCGVGYRVFVPEQIALALTAGAQTRLYTHYHVREDAVQLFGFGSAAERDWFELLMNVTGIGPKVALQIVAATAYGRFRAAMAEEDIGFLCTLPGVGRKTAQRLIVELKDKLEKFPSPPSSLEQVSGRASTSRYPSGPVADVIEALKVLGYQERQAAQVVAAVVEEAAIQSVEEGLRRALKRLAP